MQTPALSDAPPVETGPAGLLPLARILQWAPNEEVSAAAAFQVIALSCLHRFEVNRDLLARTGDAEALHQARVALRQLRSAFTVFRKIAADDRFEHLRGEARWLAAATNEARDLDALIARMPAVPAALAATRRRACTRAAKILASARSDRMQRDLIDWLANGAWREVRDPADWTAAAFATASLDRLRSALAKKGRHLRALDDRDLHEVRIAAKKLRYAAWFFSGLFPGEKVERRAERFIQAMRRLQDRLGEVQDIAVAPVTLERFKVPRESWPRLPKRKKLVNRAAEDLSFALAQKPYWR